jgi:VanZ family protein
LSGKSEPAVTKLQTLRETVRLPSRRVALALWLAAVAAVVCGSLLPGSAFRHIPSFNDKLVHFLGYTVLALIPVALLELPVVGMALAAGMIPMGISIEFLQRLVPGRSFEIADMLANSLGVLTGILAATMLRRLILRPVPAKSQAS